MRVKIGHNELKFHEIKLAENCQGLMREREEIDKLKSI